MKISTYRVPVKLTRDPVTGEVESELGEERVRINSENDQEFGSQRVVMLSKEISDGNNKNLTMVKHIMRGDEMTKDTFVILKYIE